MNNKKVIIIIIFIIILSTFIFPNNNEYFDKTKAHDFNFNNYIGLIKLKSLLISSNLNSDISMSNFIYFKNSLENIINKNISDPKIEPDFIIIFTFINSLYYLIKFKINLWKYNQPIFFERHNNIKPYFNINLKKKIINIGFNVNL